MSDCEAEGGEAAAGVSLVVAVGGGNVGPAAEFQDADGEVAQSGHDRGPMAGADLGGVLAVGDITDVVQRFDLPVPADPGGEFFGLGLVRGEAGDGEDGDGLPSSAVAGAGPAGDADGLSGVREGQPLGDRADFDGAAFGPAVSVMGLGVPDLDLAPGQLFELPVQ